MAILNRKNASIPGSDVHPVDRVLPLPKLGLFGLQHLLVMYASTVTVPVVVAAGLGLPQQDLIYLVAADLMLCGLGTLLQSLGIWNVGVKLPMVIGASYTGIAPMLVIGQGSDIQTMYGAILVAGLFTIAVAPLVSRLMRYFPPVVIGTAIVLIGIQLVPAGGKMIAGSKPDAPDFASVSFLLLALATATAILVCYRFLPRAVRPVSVLLGIVVGVAVAAVAGMVDTSPLGTGALVAVPDLMHFGVPRFDLVACLSLVLIQIILIVELAGQVTAAGEVVGKPVPDADLAKAVRADGVITAVGGGLVQSFMYVTFAQNVGILSITKVFSRFVTAAAGVLLLALSFFPVMGQVVAMVPRPVLGAAAVIMFGTIIVVGMQILAKVDFSQTSNLVIVAAGLGIGLLPTTINGFYGQVPDQLRPILGSGVAAGLFAAVLLNLLFHHVPQRRKRGADTTG